MKIREYKGSQHLDFFIKLRLDTLQATLLDRLTQLTHIPKSELIRLGLSSYLYKIANENELPPELQLLANRLRSQDLVKLNKTIRGSMHSGQKAYDMKSDLYDDHRFTREQKQVLMNIEDQILEISKQDREEIIPKLLEKQKREKLEREKSNGQKQEQKTS